MNASDNSIIGVGKVEFGNSESDRFAALIRIYADISRQLDSAVKNMTKEFKDAKNLPHTEIIAKAVSKTTLRGVYPLYEGQYADVYWQAAGYNQSKAAMNEAVKRMEEAFKNADSNKK
jgi:hypothetical protein